MNGYSHEKALALRRSTPEEIGAIQETLLRDHLRKACHAPFYRKMFTDLQCEPDEITLSTLSGLPLTTRHDLEKDPAALFATAATEQVDLALTSGSTGDPVLVPYTAGDLERLAFNEQMGFWGAGIRADDRILLCVTLDRCFIAGLAYYSGLVKLGAAAIRSGPGQPARQWELIDRLLPTGLVGVPTFLLKMAQWGQEHGRNTQKSTISSIITIGEPVRKPDNTLTPLGRELEEAWGCRVFSSYGATELETAFCECTAQCGGHVHPELMLAEIIDDQGTPLPPGKPGELVVTPLGVEGLPLVRFRTGDIARLHDAPCACGWQTPRLGAIEGRLAQRLKFRGTTLYPEMIFQALQELPEIKSSYIEVRSSYDLSDEITVVAGIDGPAVNENQRIAEFLQARLRVQPAVTVREHIQVQETMDQAGGRKLKQFFDLRGERTR
ncbi:MAG: AMP-binding protein [Proteobacteria bacterium]|nr:AMP-binding protein [Pseudomonadota bacterium]MBU1739137.1 AMP-binding protein [Pseudomonadota bacterium]